MLTLTRDELFEITGKKRPQAQREVLREMGIPHRLRPDGTAIVLRAVIEQELGYAPKKTQSSSPKLRLPAARGVFLREERALA